MAARRRDLLSGLATGLSLGIAGVAMPGGRSAQAGTPPRPPDNKSLVIGALFPLSGPLAAQGNECLRGVQLATDLCNAGGGLLGRQVSLALGDASDPDRAVAEARRLISDKQPALIFGTGESMLSLGASEASEGSGVPYWELTGTMPAITTRGFHYLLRLCDTEAGVADRCLEAIATVIASALQRPADKLSVALLYADDTPGSAVQPLIAAAAHRHGVSPPMSIAYQPGAADFGALAERLAVMKPDILIHHGLAEGVVLLFTALAARDWRPQVLIGISAAYGSMETAAMVGPGFDGTLAVGVVPYGVDARLAPDAGMVGTLYEQNFGASPRSGLSFSHFAGAGLCFDILRLAKSADKDKVLAVVRGIALARGSLANGWGALFGQDGQNLRAFSCLSQWQKGKQVALLPKDGAAGAFRLRT
ncbi:MAG TPA: ABC transporter substrate-binding protein [Acidisoma sp.]|jgi:branched-chain amino acid transport system substrate-binding protein|uniref:ABC transporter substrate-binding protein n=1 Tax=Acidisoma sp. TaxID=1872115 RepID=UPI002C1022D3|nr:ABC transporter substrate-binding protein [Acidisoma sp.]HTI03392.1 ABC transporter substrate-binding protein [Acidisoma sp.]